MPSENIHSPLRDDFHFPRQRLALDILRFFDTGAGWQVLISRRRMGKTTFARIDLTDAAHLKGYEVFYFSFFDNGRALDNPVEKFLERLTEFVAGLENPRFTKLMPKRWRKAGKVKIKDLEIGLPEAESVTDLLDRLAASLAKRGKKALLILDEAQVLAHDAHKGFMASLRTGLDMHKLAIKSLFTGSSKDGLMSMFGDKLAPFFTHAAPLPFDPFDSAFTDHLAGVFEKITGRSIDAGRLYDEHITFDRVTEKTRQLIDYMLPRAHLTLDSAAKEYRDFLSKGARERNLWDALSPLAQSVLKVAIERGPKEYTSASFREEVGKTAGVVPSATNIIDTLAQLEKIGVISRHGTRGLFVIEDEDFRAWLKRRVAVETP